ncbi:MAG: Membrane-bound lytic murein transglycosylase B precursor [Candidatus Accumulibacter cognatus]|uniref:Membrane-bound lytic murein transglycosylase B n=2 Tax=Candidatus Accumulibacter cognatus TaxID=2954383 RepID=A0A080M9S5_9PROT|nr:MAG: Membrane-bound lytic murein transglycosylase B precursor [Candidatus Accumulibacter cognatus]
MNKSFAMFGLLGCLLSLPGHGQSGTGFSQEPEVQAFIIGMHEQHGFDVAHLTRQFAVIRPNATVLRAIRPPAFPEKQRSWQRYRERFLNSSRIGGGLSFWQKHAATLQRAQATYGVPAEVIVSIIGVETVYGQNMGSFGVFEALASLAFHYPPRAEFFRGELEQFLLLARENGVSPLDIKGSYAGAIGIPQFMPSSQRRFAVDFDGDDRIDLRSSSSDAIGSVARFLQQHGWQSGAPVAVPASVSGDPAGLLAAGIKPALTVREMAAEGVVAVTTVDGDRTAALIDLVTPGATTEYWLGFDNFYVITRYNRSSFYAMSVFQLAEALRTAHDKLIGTR